jgi:hypothetical protein
MKPSGVVAPVVYSAGAGALHGALPGRFYYLYPNLIQISPYVNAIYPSIFFQIIIRKYRLAYMIILTNVRNIDILVYNLSDSGLVLSHFISEIMPVSRRDEMGDLTCSDILFNFFNHPAT